MPQVTVSNTRNPADLATLVRDSATPIVDYGVAHRSLGYAPPADHIALTQTGGILEHYVRDLTVRAAAGITIGDLQTQLMKTGQFLPVDADDDLTLGEVIDHNVYGPLRVGYGSIRDLMLGLHYIDGLGRDIHVGGRTVKNVAGYDLARFMVGSLGQFGIVHEATLRTYAVPKQVTIAHMTIADPATLDENLTRWQLSDAWPTWLELRREEGAWRLRAGYYGRLAAHPVQIESLKKLAGEIGGLTFDEATTCSLTDDLRDRQKQRAWRRSATSMVKVIVPPATTGKVANVLAPLATNLEVLPAHGCLFASGDAAALDQAINPLVAELGGFRVWHARPSTSISPFAPRQSDWTILARLKQTMDPRNILNPGRFLPVESVPT